MKIIDEETIAIVRAATKARHPKRNSDRRLEAKDHVYVGRLQLIRITVLAAGVDENAFDAFVKKVGLPPHCYDKTCWWLKKLGNTFGKQVARNVADAIFG